MKVGNLLFQFYWGSTRRELICTEVLLVIAAKSPKRVASWKVHKGTHTAAMGYFNPMGLGIRQADDYTETTAHSEHPLMYKSCPLQESTVSF